MTEHKSSLFVLISVVVIYWQVLCADGLVWKDAPDEVVNVQQGSNITLRWHYEMEENETFFCSEFVSKLRSLATRYKGESRHYYFPGKKQNKFAISGKNNVTLNLFSAELGSSNSVYCFVVKWDSDITIMREERCTTIYIYDPPRITSHTPQLYCKQGDLVKLQCNATGYPEPRVTWINKDTKQIIGSSSVTSLNITGKRSEGSYCCEVKNRFGREIACTTVKVTEYKPENTTVVYWVSKNTLHIKCIAKASPPPNYFLITINEKQYNSTKVIKTFRYISTQNNTVSCIPFNKYGQGPMEKINLPVFEKITKDNSLPLIVGIPCTGIVLIAICTVVLLICWKKKKAITSQEKITKDNNLPLIVGISCAALMVLLICWKKRKAITSQDKKPTDGGSYAAPLDTVVPSVEVLLPKRDTLPDDGYSNPEELGFPKTIKSQRPKMEEPQNETLLA